MVLVHPRNFGPLPGHAHGYDDPAIEEQVHVAVQLSIRRK